jgi:CHAT domain-containing protein
MAAHYCANLTHPAANSQILASERNISTLGNETQVSTDFRICIPSDGAGEPSRVPAAAPPHRDSSCQHNSVAEFSELVADGNCLLTTPINRLKSSILHFSFYVILRAIFQNAQIKPKTIGLFPESDMVADLLQQLQRRCSMRGHYSKFATARRQTILCFLFLAFVLSWSAEKPGIAQGGSLAAEKVAQNLDSARAALEKGEYGEAIRSLRLILDQARNPKKADLRIEALLLLAEGYAAMGRHSDSAFAMEKALKLQGSGGAPERLIQIQDRLAMAYRQTGQQELARQLLGSALKTATSFQRRDLEAILLNDLGNLQAESDQLELSLQSFGSSIKLARESGQRELEATARVNETGALIQGLRDEGLAERLAQSHLVAKGIPNSHQKALCLLSIGSQYWLAQWYFGRDASWRQNAYNAYVDGLGTARAIGDRRLISHALGSIGRLYEDERRFDEALGFTRQAASVAQQANASEILYLWEWQVARIMRDRGETDQAITGYRRSIEALDDVRESLFRAGIPFQRIVGPVFRELADILLHRASALQDRQAAQRDLQEVRAILEKLKQAEVAQYFRDDCVAQPAGLKSLDSAPAKTAILYPVLLPDRTEILLSLGGALEQYTLPVGLSELTNTIREFRQKIEVNDSTEGYMPQARRLYSWMIQPLEKSLDREGVNLLVIVPDGPLRTIPISALHDGKEFLIEKYAVVTTPGLSLTSARPISRVKVKVLANGLTEATQGFSPLPNVASELESIQSLFPTTRIQDRSFRTMNVEREVAQGSFSIVHFATHGHFDSDFSKSFLVTYDGKISMNDLQDSVGRRRYSNEPLEMLVLSACETAFGNDRAALGLAGVGLKAGARSVVASLWSISDESTSMFVSELYGQLKGMKTTRAEALREAQRTLLKQQRFRHPYFWAPFLLIGNWL